MSILMQRLLRRYMAPEGDGSGGGGGGGGDGGDKSKQQTHPEPETFSREYVKELREENKSWRQKNQATEQERDTHKTAAEQAAKDADERVKAAEKAANDRIMRSELKTIAITAGMIDLDGLKLADLSKVTLKDDGTLEGADAMLEQLKKDKPYLFGTPTSTSSTKTPPDPKDPKPKLAKDMTDEEYAAERKKIR